MRRSGILVMVLLILFCARASGEWMLFDENHVPEGMEYLVREYTGSVRITFLGDCTLGG